MAVRPDQPLTEIIRVLQEAMRRVRSLEELSRVIEAKQASVESNVFKKTEDLRRRTESIENAFKDLNTQILKLESEVANVKKYLNKVAAKSELEEFRNYIELMSPLRTHYVTEADVRRILEESRSANKK